MKKWQIIEDENIADLAVKVFGKNEVDLLQNILLAFASLTTEIDKLKEIAKLRNLKIKGENFEEQVFNFIEKLIYLKDTKSLLFKRGEFQVLAGEITANLFGQKITSDLPVKIDIKALTRHKFKVTKNKYYKVFMVLDI